MRRALRNHEIEVVVLGSDGGNVFEGLSMAGILNDKGIATYVPELPEDMGCYSACAYMFFGGPVRLAVGGLAVHQAGSYGSSIDNSKQRVSETQQSTQFTVSEIIGFLNEFNTPPWVYEKMFRSREFYEFDDDEIALLSVRSDEIDEDILSSINGFVEKFFNYLQILNEKKDQVTIDTSVDKPVQAEPEVVDKPKVVKKLPDREPIKTTPAFVPNLSMVAIQKFLNAAGCSAGPADGKWGAKTKSAVIAFSRDNGLTIRSNYLLSDEFIKKLSESSFDTSLRCKPMTRSEPGASSCIAKAPHASFCKDGSQSDIRSFPKDSLMRVQCGRNVGTYSLKVGSSFAYGGVYFDWKHLSGTKVIKPRSGGVILANGIYAKLRLTSYLGDSYRQKFNIKLKKTGSSYRGTTAKGCDVVVTRR